MTFYVRKTPWKNPKKKEIFLALFCTYVCMSRHKSLNISRSPNARALILVSKHFYIWGIDAIKIFSELVGGFWSYPHFSLFWNFEKFQFFGIISRTLWDTLVYTGTKSFHSWHENFWCSFFWPPVFNNEGVRENMCFSIIWIIWCLRRDTLILAGEKSYCSWQKTFGWILFWPHSNNSGGVRDCISFSVRRLKFRTFVFRLNIILNLFSQTLNTNWKKNYFLITAYT